MNFRSFAMLALVISTTAVTTGCVTGRRAIELPVPAATTVPAAKGTVVIAGITDKRTFENSPRAPSTPSMNGDVTKVGPDMRATMIGRQRNGYGKAMGDIQLSPGETVQSRTRALLEQGLRARGYTLASGPPGDAMASVDIDKFWGWFSPGFASISFEAELATAVTVSRGGETKVINITGYGKNTGQIASDDNWQEAFARAFEDFLKNLETALAGAGL